MKIWPWTKFEVMQDEIDVLKDALDRSRNNHLDAQKGHLEALQALEAERKSHDASKGNLRQMATIMALREGLMVFLLCFCLSGFGQPILRNSFTTNPDPVSVNFQINPAGNFVAVDEPTVSTALVNQWPGGPFWSSIPGFTVPWQYLNPPVGTNIIGYGTNNGYCYVQHNSVYVPAANDGIQSEPIMPMNAVGGNSGFPSQVTSYLFTFTGNVFLLGLPGQQVSVRIAVNNYLSTNSFQNIADGNNYIYEYLFPTSKTRNVEVIIAGSFACALQGIYVPPTNAFSPVLVPVQKKLVILGDSYTEDPIANYTPAQGVGLGYGHSLGLIMPDINVISKGLGGTGYVNPGSGRTAATNRIGTDVNIFSPDYVLVALGINDTSVASNGLYFAVTNTLRQITNGNPNAIVFVLGPFCPTTPKNGNNYIQTGMAISNAVQTVFQSGTNFIDNLGEFTANGLIPLLGFDGSNPANGPWIYGTFNIANSGNAWSLISSDGTHPTPNGHIYLAQRIAAELSRRGVNR